MWWIISSNVIDTRIVANSGPDRRCGVMSVTQLNIVRSIWHMAFVLILCLSMPLRAIRSFGTWHLYCFILHHSFYFNVHFSLLQMMFEDIEVSLTLQCRMCPSLLLILTLVCSQCVGQHDGCRCPSAKLTLISNRHVDFIISGSYAWSHTWYPASDDHSLH